MLVRQTVVVVVRTTVVIVANVAVAVVLGVVPAVVAADAKLNDVQESIKRREGLDTIALPF